ncbi:MAG: metal ABC transporter permease, partial [Stellaceae bacterium]
GVSLATLWTLLGLGVLTLFALAVISRPLLFATLEPELAEAKGVSLRLVSVLFLAVVAVAVAEAAQVVGVLLVFALMVGPGAAAQRLTARLGRGVALAVILAVAETWSGIALAYVTDWPTTFWIVLLSCLVYFASLSKPLRATAEAPALY